MLKPMQKSVALLIVNGVTKEDIAKKCDVSVRTIYRWTSTKEFSDYLDKLSDAQAIETVKVKAKAEARLTEVTMSAIDHLVDLSENSKSETVQMNAALQLIHLGGLKPIDRLEIDQNTTEQLIWVDPSTQDDEDEDFGDSEDE